MNSLPKKSAGVCAGRLELALWKPAMCLFVLVLALMPCLSRVEAQSRSERMITQLDHLLAKTPPGQKVRIDDMIFRADKLRAYRNRLAASTTAQRGAQSAFDDGVDLWPGGTIPYVFDEDVPSSKQTRFVQATEEWEKVANVKFRPAQDGDLNFIYVVSVTGNVSSSAVGFQGGSQDLEMANHGSSSEDGKKWLTVHELGHALGLKHEQSRSDRDNYVEILYANIDDDHEDNFDLVEDSINYGHYDFDSIMHYGDHNFSINDNETIRAKPGYTQYQDLMGNRDHLSALDVAGMIRMYGAGSKPVRAVWNTNDSGSGSLRQAITDANLKSNTKIQFAIYTTDANYSATDGSFTIRPASPLPELTATGLIIDGKTQAIIQDSNANGPEIVINGASAGTSASGLQVRATGCKIRTLVINGFGQKGIDISGDINAVGVTGCYLGTNATGTAKVPNDTGLFIGNLASTCDIGGLNADQRNVISGNTSNGIYLFNGVTFNDIENNYIGTNAAGTAALGNGRGIFITSNAKHNVIGGKAASQRNIISGNANQGVYFTGTDGNALLGNYIGPNADLNGNLANGGGGVLITGGATNAVIGGTELGTTNFIRGNTGDGVAITGDGTDGNVVLRNRIEGNTGDGVSIRQGARENVIGSTGSGNYICGNTSKGVFITGDGTGANRVQSNYIGNSNGFDASPNADGVQITDGARDNTIDRNIISGNADDGVHITGGATSGNLVLRNKIGLREAGTSALPNGGDGVLLDGGTKLNIIGGEYQGNFISGNTGNGVVITGSGTNNNQVMGNTIGLSKDGTAAFPNDTGVTISNGAQLNLVGGSALGNRNFISGNRATGVLITGTDTSSNRVRNNFIGLNKTGSAAIPNLRGVMLTLSAKNNIIGGATTGAGNVISGNIGEGVSIVAPETTGNTVSGNKIGTNSVGTAAIGNGGIGVLIAVAVSNTIGGTTTATRNLISGNGKDGIGIIGTASTANSIQGNAIGTNADRTAAIANVGNGIDLAGGAHANLIGGKSRNVISGNGKHGIFITGDGTDENKIQSCYIGVNPTGTSAIPNGGSGIFIAAGAQGNVVGASFADFNPRNVISGNKADGITVSGTETSGNHVVVCYIGLNGAGTSAIPNTYGVRITDGAGENTIGGTNSLTRNVISGNTSAGVFLEAAATQKNVITGNRIGTNAAGDAAVPNGSGVLFVAASENTVGGTEVGQRNLISGNTNSGISITNGATRNRVRGNYIGTLPNGGDGMPNYNGILINDASDNIIGDVSLFTPIPGAPNRIAYNTNDGVLIRGTSALNRIRRNEIFRNDGLGINLQPSGEANNTVTTNDLNDTDSGPNALQNFPIITDIGTSGDNTIISGTLNTVAPPEGSSFLIYSIDLYRSLSDVSGPGEGEVYVDSVNVTSSPGENDRAFSFTLDGKFPSDTFTVTATGATVAGTSEFSPKKRAVIISSFTPTIGKTGTSVTIKGYNFVGVQAVRFTGMSTSTTYSVISPLEVRAGVGSTATTGPITIETNDGNGISAQSFIVDNTPPTVTITNPQDRATLSKLPDSLTGTVNDNISVENVTRVSLYLYREGTKGTEYWNPNFPLRTGGWSTTVTKFATSPSRPNTSLNWSFSGNLPENNSATGGTNNLPTGTYFIKAEAEDTPGNISTVTHTITIGKGSRSSPSASSF